MDFELSEDQGMLVDTVRDFIRKDSPVERLRKLRDTDRAWDAATWKKMGELGWLGVMFPEDVGGAGMSFQEMGLILEQLGTTLVPEPIIPLVIAGVILREAGSAEQKERFLSPAIAGETSLALAWAEEQSRHSVTDVKTRAEKSGGGYKLRGKKRWVLNGHVAEHLVVSASTGSGVSLFIVDPDMKGVVRKTVKLMDGHKAAMLELDGVEVPADRLLGPEGKAAPLLELAMDYGAAAAISEASGILQSVLGMTRSYLLERKQFGVAIGSFQALQHRCVDMFVETELAKSVAIMAMIKADDPDAASRHAAISAAKVQIAESGGFVTRQGIQLHGGIGVTDEHDVGLYFKRMHSLATLFGDDQFHVERYAASPAFTRHLAR